MARRMITITSKGSFQKTDSRLKRLKNAQILSVLGRYGQEGVNALSSATPFESGETAGAWYYEVSKEGRFYTITWKNHHIVDGQQIAILLQYGHGTRTGGYVQGRDFINPAIKPIFDKIKAEVWKELK